LWEVSHLDFPSRYFDVSKSVATSTVFALILQTATLLSNPASLWSFSIYPAIVEVPSYHQRRSRYIAVPPTDVHRPKTLRSSLAEPSSPKPLTYGGNLVTCPCSSPPTRLHWQRDSRSFSRQLAYQRLRLGQAHPQVVHPRTLCPQISLHQHRLYLQTKTTRPNRA
jgi:hypothetical protein